MPDPKVQRQAPALAPVVSRPLRTAASFVLVLPKRRVIYRHWDKERYLPGEEAELVLEGEGIGDQKYEFVVEKAASEDGPWEPVASLEAKVEGARASAKYKFPKAEPKGRLSKAEWKRASASPGDRLGLHVEAEGYEGGFLSIQVERQQEDGSWDVYTRWQGTIEQGKYDGVFPVPPREGARAGQAPGAVQLDEKIVELSFEQDPVEGGTAWMEARTENLDGSQLRFVLERADEVGTWVEVGSAVSTVTKGRARNSVAVPPSAWRGAAPVQESQDPVRFAVARVHTHDQVVVSLDPGWVNGESYEVTLERRSLDGEGKWESVGAVVEQPAPDGERIAQPSGRDPDAVPEQESASPDEQGEGVTADLPEPPETVQTVPGPGGGKSPAAQPGSAAPSPQPQRPPAHQTPEAQHAVEPPTPQVQPEPARPSPQGRPAPPRLADRVQAAPANDVPEAQTAPAGPAPPVEPAPARPTPYAQPPPPRTGQAQPTAAPLPPQPGHSPAPVPDAGTPGTPLTAFPARDPARPASIPGSDIPPAPASTTSSIPAAADATATFVPAGAPGAATFAEAAGGTQVAGVPNLATGGGSLPGIEALPQVRQNPSGDSLSDVLSKARDAKDKAKDARSKLEKAQELASDLAPPDEENVEE